VLVLATVALHFHNISVFWERGFQELRSEIVQDHLDIPAKII
jgi:hypothetical protein